MKYGDTIEAIWWYAGWHWRTKKPRIYRYRIDPVPFVHKKRGKFRNWYKTPRVMNEKRQWDREYTRLKRNPKNLPDPYDDYPRSDIYDRSWKKHKKKRQWM
jgi:hypothetical protein